MLTNKVVFITGGANGIGFEMAKQFSSDGAKVTIADLNQEAIEQAKKKFESFGADVRTVVCDVTNEQELNKALDLTLGHFGRIDVLVNNAGMQFISPIENFPTDKFELLLKVMLVAPFMAIRHVFPEMKRQRFGRIINIASINGLVGFPGKAAYNSAKHAVIGLTKVAALEGASFGITVNAVCPGYVDTSLVRNQLGDLAKARNISVDKVLDEVIFPLVPQKRLLTVEEIAHYVLFLCGDRAGGITGQAVVIDGGYTAQ